MKCIHRLPVAAVPRMRVLRFILPVSALLIWLGLTVVSPAPVNEDRARKIAEAWIRQSAVFRHAAAALPEGKRYFVRSIALLLPDVGNPANAWHVSLHPSGYLIVNQEDRLTPVIAFSPSKDLDFSDHPQNAFRAMLLRDLLESFQDLTAMDSPQTQGPVRDHSPPLDFAAQNQAKWMEILGEGPYAKRVAPAYTPTGILLVHPLLQTTWNQGRHYNKLCPAAPNALPGYDGRVPVGCVPTAAAQVLKYHQWPPYGTGTYSYSDTHFAVQGYHRVDFSDAYDWGNMKNSYDPWLSEPAAQVSAIAELMYELGVSAEIDYEADGSSSSINNLGASLADHFYYVRGTFLGRSNSPDLDRQLRNEILQQRPTVVAIPNHAIVADGLADEFGFDYYHINYGWGGSNNDWYLLANINGKGLEGGLMGVEPRFMPLFLDSSPITSTSSTFTLEWTFPQRLLGKVTQYRLLQNQVIIADTIAPGTSAWTLQNIPNGQYAYALQAHDGSRWGDTSPAKLVAVTHVVIGPSITTQPQSRTVIIGATVTLRVSASGAGPLNYQWRFDGVNIPGATLAAYTITNVQTSHAGDYSVKVSDSQGWVLSRTAVLTVTPAVTAPSILSQPESHVIPAGGIVTFAVLASGSQPLNYRWRFNEVNIPGATGAVYLIPKVQTGHAGNYSVNVSNGGGTVTSATAVLTVIVPPSITAPPQSRTVAPGGRMTFTVVATGTAPLSYQWCRNNVSILGATAASYTISAVQPSDAGNYMVRVRNSGGTVSSAIATLAVQCAPVIILQPQSQTVIAGNTVTFNVIANGGPSASYQWRRNGTNLAGATDPTYIITGVTSAHAGDYTLVVDNDAGTVTSAVAGLVVLDPIPGLFNTGVTDHQTVLDDLAVDPHYLLWVNADGPGVNAVVADSTIFPILSGPWLANSDTSKWIAPRADTATAAGGDYIYRTTFDLTGYDPATARLEGNWATDDLAIDLRLNGVSAGVQNPTLVSGWTAWVITNGFNAGTNALDFVVSNEANWTGLRVEILRAGAKLVVPSPTLAVSRNGPEVTLSWPAAATDFRLFTTPALNSPVWTEVETPTTIIGGNKAVRIQATDTTAIFRLQK